MPRNGSGTMSVSNSFSSGNEIQSSPMNANFTDMASEITNSLPRDGQAAMTGQMKAATGTAAAPSFTFGTDTNTGFYRKAADTMGIVCGGSEVGTVSASGLAFDTVTDSSSVPYDKFPSGTLMLFQQTTAPTGWTKQATHNNKALRVVSGTAGSGGSIAFTSLFTTYSTDSHTLTISQIPAHNHGGGAHTHTQDELSISTGTNVTQYDGSGADATGNLRNRSVNTGSSGTIIDTQGGGSGHDHNIDLRVQYVDLIIAAKD